MTDYAMTGWMLGLAAYLLVGLAAAVGACCTAPVAERTPGRLALRAAGVTLAWGPVLLLVLHQVRRRHVTGRNSALQPVAGRVTLGATGMPG